MNIYIGADHGGYLLKEEIIKYIENEKKYKLKIVDMGSFSEERTDYPIYAEKVAKKVKEDTINNKGILICKSGHGMVYSANKFKGIRASLAYSEESIKNGIEDDDINIICISSNDSGIEEVKKYIDIIEKVKLKEKDPRYLKRIEMVEEIEEENMK